MSEDRKKILLKKGTGTVPKIKYGNNRINQYTHHQRPVVPNNLSSDWLRQDFSGLSPNCTHNIHSFNSYSMESSLADDHNYSLPQHNSDLHQLTMTSNGALLPPNISEPNSRRDSVATIPKCQNVSKFPEKQKIEDKLNQIREYLRVTTSLMSTLKNSEDPQAVEKEKEHFDKMVKDLKDSEAKLIALLNIYETAKENHEKNEQEVIENGTDNFSEPSTSGYQSNISQRNEIEDKVEQSNQKILMLQEQQNALINLKKKAENQLLDAKQKQVKLLKVQQKQNEENRLRNDKIIQERLFLEQAQVNSKIPKISENNFDATIRELEDTLNGLKTYHNNADVDTLQERLESSNQLIHMLGTRDAQLNSEHLELQEKLNELQTKKQQIDQLASELQNLNEDNEDEDIGQQVRKIVTMKQQLTKLKDMLEIVKNAELRLVEAQNCNDTDSECPENFTYVEKNDNIRQNIHTNQPNIMCDNTIRIDNNARTGEQYPIEKESNKISSNIREREKMLAELKAKKRELEEIIFKQKDRTLINNDICSESSINKSEMSGFEGAPSGYSLPPSVNRQNRRSSFYSSDEFPEDVNEYSEIKTEPRTHSRLSKQREEEIGLSINPVVDYSARFQPAASRSSECRSNATTSVAASFNRHQDRSTSINDSQSKNEIQKQLETIQGMCQSLIEQQHNNTTGSNRNNHTPSPLYAEPRRYTSPGTRESSVLNVVNPVTEIPGFPAGMNGHCYGLNNDVSNNNQNLLAANTLQLQAFLLNTLNQCCQMLWFQQREIASLRHTITLMQDRMIPGGAALDQTFRGLSDSSTGLPPFINSAPPSTSIFRSPLHNPPNPKVNHQPQPVAAACSMPNLNQSYISPQTQVHTHQPQNNELPYENRNSVRMLETTNFNNMQNNQIEQSITNNHPSNISGLHNINTAINHHQQQPLPGQVWNGQALNNQVAPGNRANNYWDNFRSYSRQNLLSTSKSNEGVQNVSGMPERSNRTHQERSHSQCTNYTLPKSNAAQNESSNLIAENHIRQVHSNKPSSNSVTSNPGKSPSLIPPDVLNVTHVADEETANCTCSSSSSNPNFSNSSNGSRKFKFRLPSDSNEPPEEDRKFNYYLLQEQNQAATIRKPNFRVYRQDEDIRSKRSFERRVSAVSNTSDESVKELPSHRNRNEWNEGEDSSNSSPKSKLFEQLRDSVYKEVANLISANETRPHFLIQLFRDLQLVNSDPLRHRTLHSIQTMITNPMGYSDTIKAVSSQTSVNQVATQERNTQVKQEFFCLDNGTGWPQSPASSSQTSSNMDIETANDPDVNNVNNIIRIVAPFLKRHHEDIFQEELLEMLKALLIKAMPFGEIFANTNIQESTFHKHFAAIITEALYKFQGKRVQEIRKELIRTITEVLLGEFSFIHLVQENIPETRESTMIQPNSVQLATSTDENVLLIKLDTAGDQSNNGIIGDEAITPQIQNGDLAEADQSHIGIEEEGAVGGIGFVEDVGNEEIVVQDDSVTVKLEYPVSTEVEADLEEQGLDQVPTRLTTSSRPHSGTPSRGKKKRKR
ncbi:pericentriolar material 1 protein isoform X2 [Agrilus planipennis]|uniref:Pericentriolar material 1 protein isoform X2 n=1 Tax=Agrilus planipennis TaxID=224129 RepID=A0A7F5R3W1_AGRPL|nr:pericentriolar material 1 protein isoform X2 [Agrilus planipennis]